MRDREAVLLSDGELVTEGAEVLDGREEREPAAVRDAVGDGGWPALGEGAVDIEGVAAGVSVVDWDGGRGDREEAGDTLTDVDSEAAELLAMLALGRGVCEEESDGLARGVALAAGETEAWVLDANDSVEVAVVEAVADGRAVADMDEEPDKVLERVGPGVPVGVAVGVPVISGVRDSVATAEDTGDALMDAVPLPVAEAVDEPDAIALPLAVTVGESVADWELDTLLLAEADHEMEAVAVLDGDVLLP